MGQRKYPPLKPSEIEDILLARGFSLHKKRGDHRFYIHEVRGEKRIAQVDMGSPSYNSNMIKVVLKQSGMTREEFYCSTKNTAKKIGLKCATAEELISWAIA